MTSGAKISRRAYLITDHAVRDFSEFWNSMSSKCGFQASWGMYLKEKNVCFARAGGVRTPLYTPLQIWLIMNDADARRLVCILIIQAAWSSWRCMYFQILQTVFFGLCVLNNLFGTNYGPRDTRTRSSLQKTVDRFYAAIAWPLGLVSNSLLNLLSIINHMPLLIDEFAEDGAQMLWLWSVMRFTSNKGSRRPLVLSEVNLSALRPDAFWVCAFVLFWLQINWASSSANSSIESYSFFGAVNFEMIPNSETKNQLTQYGNRANGAPNHPAMRPAMRPVMSLSPFTWKFQ
jgi:hypothetical protein